MSLTVTTQNITGDYSIADYSYTVQINDLVIAEGVVMSHERSLPWTVLLRKVLAQLEPCCTAGKYFGLTEDTICACGDHTENADGECWVCKSIKKEPHT